MSADEVDIFVPFYGDPGLLKQTVQSVLKQNNPNWRLTVVDDGYPDETIPGYFAELAEKDERVRYERNEKNLGANGNFRKCLGLAEYDLVAIMGADDLYRPNYVDVVLSAYRTFPDAAVVQPGVQVIDEHNTPVRPLVDTAKQRIYMPKVAEPTRLSGEELAASLLASNWTYFPSLCFSRERVTKIGFRQGLNVVQDLALLLDLVKSGGSMVVDPTVCFEYRRHSASDSSWRALEGTRFVEERDYFLTMAGEMEALGWHKAAKAGRRHISSRLNAATFLPAAIKKKHTAGIKNLARHAFGPAKPSTSKENS
ncbi:glycosyltransferase family 2 protein [Catenulispora subtropica]|uniref:Glycosyltransferase 2-like domain-containing protein n=1 Tax=Catenulispora subtropica TaxID=450798 RepID=A0ABP5DF92_9ACTN